MASAVATTPPPWGDTTPPKIVRLWSDKARLKQRARFEKLRTRQFEESRDAGRMAWEKAKEWRDQLPPEIVGDDGVVHQVRVDVPSPDVFALVLGVFRAGATLSESKGDGKMLELELSAWDLAKIIKRSKTTVEAALRWLGCQPIIVQGVELCRPLGWLHRRRRYGRAYFHTSEGTRLGWAFRTSSTLLTLMGRAALKLATRIDEKRRNRAVSGAPASTHPPTPIRGSTDPQGAPSASSEAAGRSRQLSTNSPDDDAGGPLSATSLSAVRALHAKLGF